MQTDTTHPTQTEPSTLLRNVLAHSEGLLRQQLALVGSEARQELGKATHAAVYLGAGTGLVAAGGVLSTLMLVHLLQRSSRLPRWACYGLVAGGLTAAGAGLVRAGRRSAATVRLDLPQSAQGLQENLTWLREQLTPAT
jgi:hypothetical protein